MQYEQGLNFDLLRSFFPFNGMTDADLMDVIPMVERRVYNEGTVLFRWGDEADFIYFIQSGHVRVTGRKKEDEVDLCRLSDGSLFGEEAAWREGVRVTSAQCADRVTLLRISTYSLHELARTNPKWKDALQLISSSARLSSKLEFPWRTPQEPVVLITRRHPFFLVSRLLLGGIFSLAAFSALLYWSFTASDQSVLLLFAALAVLGLGCFTCAWAALEWANDYVIITRERVICQHQLIGFNEGRQESPMSAILSTGTDSSVWGRTVGFGTVVVRSYTGNLRMTRLPHPELVYSILEMTRQRVSMQNRREDQARMEEALARRLHPGTVHTAPVIPNEARHHSAGIYDSNSFSDFLARIFGLRVEDNGNIIYRTHWFILMKRTFLPTLILVGVVITVLLRFAGFFAVLSETFVYSLALIASVAGWGWWIYRFIDWYNDVYIITGDQLVDLNRKPLGYEEKRSAPIKNIQTVEYMRQGLIGLILNYGTVRIKIGNEDLTFDNVYKPSAIQREVYASFAAYNEKIKQNEQERLADWIQTYDRLNRQEQNKTQ